MPRTIAGDDGLHAGCQAGLNIADVVPEINAMRGGNVYFIAGGQERFGVWLGIRQFIAADDAGEALCQTQYFNQRMRKTRRFVSDDAPGQVALLQLIEQRVNTGKKTGIVT